jgi:hypothetical protein
LEEVTVKGIRISKISTLIAVSALASSIATSALAALPLPYGWYLEGNLGVSKQSNRNYGAGTSYKNQGMAGSVVGGFKFMPYFGVEAAYTRYADTNIKDSAGNTVAKDRLYSYDIAGKGILPIAESGFSLFAKLGIVRASSTIRVTDSTQATADGLSFNTKQRFATGLYMGLGGDYAFLPNLAVNAQWARARGSSSTTGYLDLYSLGLTWLLS